MVDKAYILNLIAQGEQEQLEFKLNFGSKAIVALNALVNTKGGILIVGVNDKEQLIGVELNKESIQHWLNEIKQKTEPAITPIVDVIEVNGKNMVVLKVHEAPFKPVGLQGRYYIRRANSNHILSINEIVEQRMDSLNQSYDSFLIESALTSLNQEALDFFHDKIIESGRYKSTGNVLNDLRKFGFLHDDKLTYAAELLFGNNQTAIHIGRFKSASTIIDDILIKKPLLIAVNEALQFIQRNIRLEYEFSGEVSRKERWQFPLQAIRELLLNAVIHKDYKNPTDIIIKIFDDSIQFSNPGNLFGNLTPDDLNTDEYLPRHRNRLLAEAFYLTGAVEKYGTGFIRIREWLKEYPSLHLNIVDLGDFTNVLIAENTKLGDKLGDRLGDRLGDNKRKILAIIKEQPKISLSQLSKELGISQTAVENNINKLKTEGKLLRVGPAKGGHWQVNKE